MKNLHLRLLGGWTASPRSGCRGNGVLSKVAGEADSFRYFTQTPCRLNRSMQHHLIGMIFLKVVFMAQGKRDRLSAGVSLPWDAPALWSRHSSAAAGLFASRLTCVWPCRVRAPSIQIVVRSMRGSIPLTVPMCRCIGGGVPYGVVLWPGAACIDEGRQMRPRKRSTGPACRRWADRSHLWTWPQFRITLHPHWSAA
jgi:hypothetical protein